MREAPPPTGWAEPKPLAWYHKALGYFILLTFFRPGKWLCFNGKPIDNAAKAAIAVVLSLAFWALTVGCISAVLAAVLRLGLHRP